jgi:hypothetical protein
MTGDGETRDRLLGDLLEQITVPRLEPTALERLARGRGAATPLAARRHRRPLLIVSAATLAAAAALAVVLTLPGSNPPSPGSTLRVGQSGGTVTNVRTLLVFGRLINARRSSALPPGFAAAVARLSSRFGESPVTTEPIIGSPSIYLATFEPNDLCVGLAALSGSAWSCGQTLQEADGSLYIHQAFILGQSYVFGLAANDVTSITVSAAVNPAAPATIEQAQLANNAFVAPVPDHLGLGLGVVTLTVTRTDGSTATVTLGGPKLPLGRSGTLINRATGAPGAADASKKRVLIQSGDATLWTAPRSDGSGYCVWLIILPNGGGGSGCNLPGPPGPELGLGIQRNPSQGLLGSTTLSGQVGTNVTRVVVQFANGSTTTLGPVDGWVLLAGIAPEALPLTAIAYNSAGAILAKQTLSWNSRP